MLVQPTRGHVCGIHCAGARRCRTPGWCRRSRCARPQHIRTLDWIMCPRSPQEHMSSPHTPSPALQKSYETYTHIVLGYADGLFRVAAARMTQLTLEIAVLKFRATASPRPQVPAEYSEVLQELESISPAAHADLKYIANFGQLVFVTTLLDTFLTDTTEFIFMLRPASIGKSQGITVADIVDAKSTSELLRRAVEQKAREVSYKSFIERVEYLEKQYGLQLKLDAQTRKQIEHHSSVRNVLIHDHAAYDLRLDPDGSVIADPKGPAGRPRLVAGEDIRDAVIAYGKVVESVGNSIFVDFLKLPIPNAVVKFWQLIEGQKSNEWWTGTQSSASR